MKSDTPGSLVGQPTGPISLIARRYLDALIVPSRLQALETVIHALRAGMPPLDLYVDVIGWAHHRIGDLWERNEISVSQEHVATAISQLALSQIYPSLPRKQPAGRTAIVACVEGELHDMGARMVADMLETEGFEVVLLGANPPTDSLGQMVRDLSPDVVGLSVSMESFLPAAVQAVERIREAGPEEIQILVGGHAASELGAYEGVHLVDDELDVREVITGLTSDFDARRL
ncbi:hypothetical protein BH23CHL2_BH23CHL2_12230 [soil metagenome]